jgi:hypothetical protein
MLGRLAQMRLEFAACAQMNSHRSLHRRDKEEHRARSSPH